MTSKGIMCLCAAALLTTIGLAQQPMALKTHIQKAALAIEPKCIAWRRQIHQHPELGNQEYKTANLIAAHLSSLGLEVKENVAKTGVVAILKGKKPGPVIGLRADMDALPVEERVKVPFASIDKAIYNGQEVGTMHACGHDAHVAMLMSAAEILAGMKENLSGTVKFVFQPAEEGPPEGEEGGAPLMVKEGVLDNPKVEAMFGLHINAQLPVGQIRYREEGIMAASDWFTIKVKGKQSHGSQPWLGIDPIVTAAQIINSLQTIISRQTDLTKNAAVISVGIIKSGVRANIIPEEAELTGTIRTLDKEMQRQIHERIKNTATHIAEANGAKAVVTIDNKTLVTYNDVKLTQQMVPSLISAAGKDNVKVMDAVTGAEDFSFFADKVPSLFFYLGGMPLNADVAKTAAHHTPDFYIDESGMKTGIEAFCYLVLDYMQLKNKK